jgi:CBS domain-containing protein
MTLGKTFGRRFTGRRGRDAQRTANRALERARQTMPEPPATALWIGLGVLAALLLPLILAGGRRRRRVGDVMVSPPITIDASESLKEAAQRMREGNVGALPVVENGRVRGIITDRDLVVRAMALGVDPTTTRVGDCATRTLVCARADWDVEEALRLMSECEIGRLPVVDEGDRAVGMVTLGSLALRAREDQEAFETAKQVSRRSARIA